MVGVYTTLYASLYTPGYTTVLYYSALAIGAAAGGVRGGSPGLNEENNPGWKALGSLPALIPVTVSRRLCAESFLSSGNNWMKDWIDIG